MVEGEGHGGGGKGVMLFCGCCFVEMGLGVVTFRWAGFEMGVGNAMERSVLILYCASACAICI